LPMPTTSNINKLPVKVNQYNNNNNNNKIKLYKNVEKNINTIANIIITNSLYSYILLVIIIVYMNINWYYY
jgi:hypothetical protein